jgi:hypothetical protein
MGVSFSRETVSVVAKLSFFFKKNSNSSFLLSLINLQSLPFPKPDGSIGTFVWVGDRIYFTSDYHCQSHAYMEEYEDISCASEIYSVPVFVDATDENDGIEKRFVANLLFFFYLFIYLYLFKNPFARACFDFLHFL